MSKKPKLPSQTALRKMLTSCAPNPREEKTPFRLIADTAGREYHQLRAIELIKEGVEGADIGESAEFCEERIKLAIALLGLSLLEESKKD